MNNNSQSHAAKNPSHEDQTGGLNRNQLVSGSRWVSFAALALVLLFLGFGRADSRDNAGPLKIALPPETDSFKSGPGAELANGQCLICHSVDYVVVQPPMPAAFWAAEVKKMREKYGAVISDDQVEPLVGYLAHNYGTEAGRNSATSTLNGKAAAAASTPASSEEAMASKYGCLGCHNVNVKLVGPAFKDVVAKYRDDPAAIDRVLEQIRNGSSGKWGPALMPPFPMLPDAESRTLAKWVMRQGGAPPAKP